MEIPAILEVDRAWTGQKSDKYIGWFEEKKQILIVGECKGELQQDKKSYCRQIIGYIFASLHWLLIYKTKVPHS